jgi:hypothetical protein
MDKFCKKFGKRAMETYEMLKSAFEETLGCTKHLVRAVY